MSRYEGGQQAKAGLQNSLLWLSVDNGVVRGDLRDGDAGGPEPDGRQILRGAEFVADDGCHHVVLVRDADTVQWHIFVDGKLDTSAALSDGASGELKDDDLSPDSLTIGARFAESSVLPTDSFEGVLDEVALYDRPLSRHQVKRLYHKGKHPVCRTPR